MRLREGLLRFIRQEHPDWWPQERIEGSGQGAAAAG